MEKMHLIIKKYKPSPNMPKNTLKIIKKYIDHFYYKFPQKTVWMPLMCEITIISATHLLHVHGKTCWWQHTFLRGTGKFTP
jgi:hypothetical protein